MKFAKYEFTQIQKIFIVFFTFIFIIGCNSRTDDIKSPVQYTPGNDEIVITQTIGPSGAEIVVGNINTPIDGLRINFPAGALQKEVEVSVGYNKGKLMPNSGTFSGKTLILNVPQVNEFDHPVTVTVPFVNDGTTPVPYYVDDKGLLHPTQIISINRETEEFSFQIFHASLFTWLFDIKTTSASDLDDIVETGYVPEDDGFQIENNGSQYSRPGECLGMTSFSLWYYAYKKNDRGNFFPKYYDILAYNSYGEPLRGQDIIATRAFIEMAKMWNIYWQTIEQEKLLSDADKYASIRNIILNTGNPVLIHLYQPQKRWFLFKKNPHSVLGYGINQLNDEIFIYDPNHPGKTRTIHYDSEDDSFDSYSGYNGIVYSGDGSSKWGESFQNILDDANADFHRSGYPIINIDSHVSGQQTTDRTVQLKGTIESGEVLISKLTVFVGTTPFDTNIEDDGSFNIAISLESGINHLEFVTKGNIVTDKGEIELVKILNNMFMANFTIDLATLNSVILVTLTWDTFDTDVDLYVIDPKGDYSCYYHKNTYDGGELDYDITTGYGPEHWTLMTTDIIRYDKPYKVRLHFYSDHDKGPTNYTVSIRLYEGTDWEQVYSYRGNLSVNNKLNNAPNDKGADWADIATIMLTQNNPGSLSRHTFFVKPFVNSKDKIFITTPVPLAEKRIKH